MNPQFLDIQHIRPGVTAVIGSGGKTTLLATAAKHLAGTVLLSTTTHIFPFEDVPLYTGSDVSDLQELIRRERVVCVGTPASKGKLTSSAIPFEQLASLADYVLVEADGSRHLPLKAHAAYEPVIPENADAVIWVIGSSGFGNPVRDVVHRPEIFCEVMQVDPDTIVTVQMYETFIREELLHHPLIRSAADRVPVSFYTV